MAIIVETGSGTNPAANSYVSVANLQLFATMRGYTLPSADADCEPLLIKAMDYIESKRSAFQGVKVYTDQPLQFPRAYVYVDDCAVDSATIPPEVINAQCELAVAAYTITLQPTLQPSDVGAVTKKRVEGAVEVNYAASAGASFSRPQFTAAESWLKPLYRPMSGNLVRT